MSRKTDEKARRGKLAMEPTIPATEMTSGRSELTGKQRSPDERAGSSMKWVVVTIVAAVGTGFWWLSGHAPRVVPHAAAPAVSPPSKPAVAPPPPAPSSPPVSPSTRGAPVAANASSATASAAPQHKQPHRRRQKAVKKTKPVKLPRLPSPPPADP